MLRDRRGDPRSPWERSIEMPRVRRGETTRCESLPTVQPEPHSGRQQIGGLGKKDQQSGGRFGLAGPLDAADRMVGEIVRCRPNQVGCVADRERMGQLGANRATKTTPLNTDPRKSAGVPVNRFQEISRTSVLALCRNTGASPASVSRAISRSIYQLFTPFRVDGYVSQVCQERL